MRKYAAQIIALCILIAIVVAIRLSGADSYLTVENLRKHKELLEQFISARYALSVFVYMLVYLVSVAFSVPGATVLTLAGGFLFHLFPGIVYVNVGVPHSRSCSPGTFWGTRFRTSTVPNWKDSTGSLMKTAIFTSSPSALSLRSPFF